MRNPISSLASSTKSNPGLGQFVVLTMLGVLAHAVELTPPAGWQRQEKVPAGIVLQFIAAVPQGQFAPNLNVSHRKLNELASDSLWSPAQLSEQMTRQQARLFPLFKVIESATRKIGAIEGSLLASSYAYGNLDLTNLQFVFLQGLEVYTIVYTCEWKDLKRLRPEFDKSLATLKLESANPAGNRPK